MYNAFDYFSLQSIPDFYLANPNYSILYSLQGIYNRKYSPRFNALSEISFTAPYSIDGIVNEYYNKLVHMRYIYVNNVGYFVITSVKENNDGIVREKEIIAQSAEVVFASKRVTLFKGTYKFYDPITPTGTLLSTLLGYVPGWTVGTVSSSLYTVYRTFNVTDTTLYSLMMNDVEQAYNCVFIFDTNAKTVSAYDLDNATSDTDIFISYDNLIESGTIEESTDELVTALTVVGGGELDIRRVNPLGTNTIYDFDYFTSTDWMSASLVTSVTNWSASVVSASSTYAAYYTQLENLSASLITISASITDLQGQYDTINGLIIARVQLGNTTGSSIDLTDLYAQLQAKQQQINIQKLLYYATEYAVTTKNSQLDAINTQLSFTNNFTAAGLAELSPFILQSSYVNENFIKTDTMTSVEIQEEAQALYNQGKIVLNRLSEPRYTFDLDVVNFMALQEYQPFISQIELGAVVNLEVSGSTIAYPVLLGMDINYDDPTDFKLIFGNRLRLSDGAFDYADLFGSTVESTTTSKVDSSLWTNSASYVNDTVSVFIDSALNAALNNVISGSSQNIIVDSNGLRARQAISELSAAGSIVYANEQIWMTNNMIAFTKDNWRTCSTALGKIKLPTSASAWGLVSEEIAFVNLSYKGGINYVVE